MKLIIVLYMLFSLVEVAEGAVETPMWRCECAPAVPFEGFQIYAIETLNGKESWMLLQTRASQYDDAAICAAALSEEKVCQDFLLL